MPTPDDPRELDDHALAADLAGRAGRLLLSLRAKGGDPRALRDAGDRQSHDFLMAELAKARPGDAVLSEEGKTDDKARLTADRVWIVDPLDGTREFGEPGRTDWAVHVALWARTASAPDGELVAGAVALPAQGRVLATKAGAQAAGSPPAGDDPPGTYRAEAIRNTLATGGADRAAGTEATDDQQVTGDPRQDEGHAGAQRPLRMVVSRSRASDLVKDVAARLDAELVPCGSAGAKVATVILGENDVYLHSGGFYEWDTAAPVAVARANGFHVSRIDGSDVRYNQENPLLPDILVCRFAIADRLLDAIRTARGTAGRLPGGE